MDENMEISFGDGRDGPATPFRGENRNDDVLTPYTEPIRRVTTSLAPPKRYFRRFWLGLVRRAMLYHSEKDDLRSAFS